MKISIALCTYRGTQYLQAQLLSLLNQTRPADEVIIRDDCSGDDTADQVEAFITAHRPVGWRLIRAQKNSGFIRNFRDCIAETSGDWVALCDQDDIWEPDKLERMEAFVSAHPDAEAVAGGFTLIDSGSAPLPDRRKYGIVRPRQLRQLGITDAPFSKAFSFDKAPAPLLCRNFAPGCTVLFSSRIRSLYLQSTQAKAPHDWEILLIAQLLDGLYYLNAPTIRYRLHDHNTIGIPNATPVHGPSKSGRERVMDYYESIFHTFDGILRRVRSQPLPPRFLEYAALRRDALTNCRLTAWLRLWNYRDIYHTMFPFRQRMGDLVFILTKRGDRS